MLSYIFENTAHNMRSTEPQREVFYKYCMRQLQLILGVICSIRNRTCTKFSSRRSSKFFLVKVHVICNVRFVSQFERLAQTTS